MSACFAGLVRFKVVVEPCDGVFFIGVKVGYEDCKLVATEARNNVRAPEAAIEYFGGVDECVVAFVMSKLVVDPFHPIKVDEKQEQVFLLAACEIEVGRSLFEHAATVE